MYRYEISCPFNLRSPAVPVSSKASSTSFIKTKALRINEVNRELSVPRVYREKSFTRRLNTPIFGSLFIDKESRFANSYSFTLNQGLTRGRGKQAKLALDRRGKSVVTEVDYRTGVGENIVKDWANPNPSRNKCSPLDLSQQVLEYVNNLSFQSSNVSPLLERIRFHGEPSQVATPASAGAFWTIAAFPAT